MTTKLQKIKVHSSYRQLLAFTLAAFSASAAQTQEVRLEAGATYESHILEGSVTVWCRDPHGPRTHHTYCRATTLEPAMTSFAVGPTQTGADELILTATHESGSRVTKDMDYDDSAGRTERRVNLWISSLLQRPLLKHGENSVAYQLKRGSRTVGEGNFSVQVNRGAVLQCPHDYLHARFPSDCRGVAICGEYFDRNISRCR